MIHKISVIVGIIGIFAGYTALYKHNKAIVRSNLNVVVSIYPNGYLENEQKVNLTRFDHVDQLIQEVCPGLENVSPELCAPGSGAKLYRESGIRIMDITDIKESDSLFCVAQGRLFVWPLYPVGTEFYPESVQSPVSGKKVMLKQLSQKPRVISVSNFISDAEVQEILEFNKPRVSPSEVGFAGSTDSTRTSSTSWDSKSKAARALQRRSFDVLGLDFDIKAADTVQVLNYKPDQWYKPHVDWFNEKAYKDFDPKVNNGTNRFATVFLYLNDVEEGGSTVFPLARDHEGYNGEEITHEGTINTPGYIDTAEAKRACTDESTALKSRPKKGTAVIFYSQEPDGTLDAYSLHGGCPPVVGEKWSANIWVWNRPKPSKEKALDGDKNKPFVNSQGQIEIEFNNVSGKTVTPYWLNEDTDELLPYQDMIPNGSMKMNTYRGHVWVFKAGDEEVYRWRSTASMGRIIKIPGKI